MLLSKEKMIKMFLLQRKQLTLKKKNKCLDKTNYKIESTLDNCNLNLKRTAGREKYALSKIKKKMKEKVVEKLLIMVKIVKIIN